MPSPETRHAATCGGCGLVCDDITARRRRRRRARAPRPHVPARRRVVRRARSLRRRRSPASTGARPGSTPRSTRPRRSSAARARRSSTGWGRRRCEAQRAAVALAETIGAVIDPAGPLLDGASGLAFQARGASTATLGDVRDRAEVVVVWRADPVTTHPRLLERLRLPARAARSIVVDERRTATAEQADTFIELPGRPRRRGAVDAAGARPRGARRSRPEPPLDDLAARLRGCRSVAILHHVRGHVAALGLHALVRDLCRVTHAVAVTLRHEGNAAGAEDVLAWQTGYPSAVSFASGHPRVEPGRAERGRGARARRSRRGARRRLRSARASAAGGRGAPARDPRRDGRRPRHGDGGRRARRVHDRRGRACTGPASCTGSTACRCRCARCSRPTRPGDEEVLRRSPGDRAAGGGA